MRDPARMIALPDVVCQAVSTDVIEASALAFLQAINRLAMRRQQRMNPQTEAVTVS